MNDRIIVPVDIEKKIVSLQNVFKASTKAVIIRLGMGQSLKNEEDPRKYDYNMTKSKNGATYAKSTLFGDRLDIYELLIKQHSGFSIDESDLDNMMKMHIIRGVELIYSDYELLGNGEKVKDKYFKELLDGGKV